MSFIKKYSNLKEVGLHYWVAPENANMFLDLLTKIIKDLENTKKPISRHRVARLLRVLESADCNNHEYVESMAWKYTWMVYDYFNSGKRKYGIEGVNIIEYEITDNGDTHIEKSETTYSFEMMVYLTMLALLHSEQEQPFKNDDELISTCFHLMKEYRDEHMTNKHIKFFTNWKLCSVSAYVAFIFKIPSGKRSLQPDKIIESGKGIFKKDELFEAAKDAIKKQPRQISGL